jgi:hypothetical protein
MMRVSLARWARTSALDGQETKERPNELAGNLGCELAMVGYVKENERPFAAIGVLDAREEVRTYRICEPHTGPRTAS